LERTTSFTQSGFSRNEPNKVSVDAPTSTVTLKGKTVPVDYVKDAMVDLLRKENVAIRTSPLKGKFPRSPGFECCTICGTQTFLLFYCRKQVTLSAGNDG
jgi:hypothetical protein